MITEKQMKIVDAVNARKAENAPSRCTTVWMLHSEGYLFGYNATNQTICTIEEYNQCIEEMKYHYDIPKWCSYNRADKELLSVENSDYSFYEKETFVHGQDVYVNNGEWKDRLMKFGCFTLDGNKALLFYVNGDAYCRVTVESISSKPFKSKKDIELEEAKFTKGDWILNPDGSITDDSPTKNEICFIDGGEDRLEPKDYSNAQLIKTAPKLYAMLDHLIKHDCISDCSLDSESKVLLAEARGQA